MSASPRVARFLRDGAVVAMAIAVGIGAAIFMPRASSESVAISKAFPFEAGDAKRLRAFVVVDPEDCSSNLTFLDLFQRDTTHLRLRRLYLRGPRSQLKAMSALLRDRGITTPLVPESKAVARALQQLGSTSTPFLVVLDADGIVRLSMDSPPGTETYVLLPKLLNDLWDQGVSDPLLK
jgi:hypothetical protein